MQKNAKKIANSIFAMVLIMSIFIISILIQANSVDIDNDVGEVVLEEVMEPASASDADIGPGISEKIIEIDSNSENLATDSVADNSESIDNSEITIEERSMEPEDLSEYELEAFAMFGEDRASSKDYSLQVDWSEKTKAYIGDSTRERNLARQMFNIEKNIDYNNREIHWKIDVTSPDNGNWNFGSTEIFLFMPRHEGEIEVTRTNMNGNSQILNFTRYRNELVYETNGNTVKSPNTNFYKDLFSYLQDDTDVVRNSQKGIREVYSDLNWWADSGRIAEAYRDNTVVISRNRTVSYEFTTRHNEIEDLEKVPMGVHIRTSGKTYRRYLFTGTFGRAARHEFQIPAPIYVDDTEHLTSEEKEEVRRAILRKTFEYYDAFNNIFTREADELRDAVNQGRIQISDRGELFVTWEDGTESSLRDVGRYIFKKDNGAPKITINPEEPVSLDTEDIPSISIDVIDDEENLYSFDIEGLPNGLSITKEMNNVRGNMQITGKVEGIVWQNGETERDFPLKVIASDTWNHTAEKEFVLKIKRDMALVPVGTNEFGYKLPILFISISLFFGIYAILNLKREDNLDV